MTLDSDLKLSQMQAEIIKVLAHAIRLRILDEIGTGEVSYGTLLSRLGVSKTNLSQHLTILRKAGVVRVRREGVHIHYRLTYPEITEVCSTMRDILAKHLGEQPKIPMPRAATFGIRRGGRQVEGTVDSPRQPRRKRTWVKERNV